ncbi:hypothetical protein PanWU01x14_159290 [Parasponia andersonii]|uniref:Uncharacterized protein n=1 Tax=Parasponia andersonii TaxID=3476 RepID=A0A2P5CED4_PARAD|nr:hypothetical protein PanWU01x14_159290 [Parasponia andersonii]
MDTRHGHAFINLRQKKGTLVWGHMMKVIAYFNELEILGAEIDYDTQIDMVLNTLSDTFNQFNIDPEIRRKDYTLTGLMKDLQITENILKKNKSGPSIEDKIEKALRKAKSLETQQTSNPHCSGRVVRQSERYFGIGESCDQESDPYTYNEVMDDVDKDL